MRGWNKMRRRGNYDSANYMEKSHGWQGSSLGFESHILRFCSYVGLTLTNKQSVRGSPHRAQSMGYRTNGDVRCGGLALLVGVDSELR